MNGEGTMRRIIDEIASRKSGISKIIISDVKSVECAPEKIMLRPVKIADKSVKFQAEEKRGKQTFHKNLTDEGLESYLEEMLNLGYRQTNIFCTDGAVSYRLSKKGKISRTEDKKLVSEVKTEHNTAKNYRIREGDDVPVMRELGIFTQENKIVRTMYDKFRQINRFIEILDDCFSQYKGDEISVLDFGCGKSYLTFLVYHYFSVIKGIKVKIIGYDLKADVVAKCSELAEKYGYDNLRFVVADVTKDVLTDEKIDMVISLHACDTATDYALSYAIDHNVGYIFSVPCCQHEINAQIKKGGDMDILLSHGLFKERLSALLTDSFRAEILTALGYDVDVLEFVDFAHSPKNLMLRCVKHGKEKREKLSSLFALEEKYSFRQTLLHLVTDDRKEQK